MQSYAYFPSIVYRDERPELADTAKGVCLHHLNTVRESGWPMCQSGPLVDVFELEGIVSYLLSESKEILRTQGYDGDKYELYVSDLWAQETTRGAATDVHLHKNSQICGWFFLEAPEKGAYPIYYDSRTLKSMVELAFIQGTEIVNATNAIHFSDVIPGTVLFGNSWMRHQLVSGDSEKPTRCLHFIVSHREK